MTTTRRSSTRRAARPTTPRIVILPYGPSESVTMLASSLSEEMSESGVNVLRMKREGSRFNGRSSDVLINWGSRNADFDRCKGEARTLNSIEAVSNAASKRRAFEVLSEAGVSIVESTRDHATARQWFDEGHVVFARNEDSGHSGAGIHLMSRDEIQSTTTESITVHREFSEAPLYTKGSFINQQHREFRVHVFKGKVIFVQQKKRREGWEDLDTYSNLVRNYHTGWIYAHENVSQINSAALYHAVKAVEALGLDFGAVDVITRKKDARVLEVNTAPGLSGTNLQTYVASFKKFFNNEEITSDFEIPEVDPLIAVREAEAASEQAIPEQPIVTRNFIKVLVGHEEAVGYYDVTLNAFILAGFDVPMEPSDVVVINDSL